MRKSPVATALGTLAGLGVAAILGASSAEIKDPTAPGSVAPAILLTGGPVAIAPFDFYGKVYSEAIPTTNSYITMTTDPGCRSGEMGPDVSNDCPLPAPPSTPSVCRNGLAGRTYHTTTATPPASTTR